MKLYSSPRKRELVRSPAPLPGWQAGKEIPSLPLSQAYAPSSNIVVHQHYYITTAPPHCDASTGTENKNPTEQASAGPRPNPSPAIHLTTDLWPVRVVDNNLPTWHVSGAPLLNQGITLSRQVVSRFGHVLTLIDCDRYNGYENDLLPCSCLAEPLPSRVTADIEKGKRRNWDPSNRQTTGLATSPVARSCFAKVDLYANSKLPPNLSAMRLYIATYPLLSLAARYSANVYEQPRGAERSYHIGADCRAGTKAMVIKSVPMDASNTIVFAIRGTANFTDWAVNLNTTPTSPAGVLDDLGNLCHAGFLSAARKMIAPVAQRLRQLLEEDIGRASYSLLITGHSAGGAVAALLYSHMLSVSNQAASELNLMAGCFRRIHCITFGVPPVSLLPLTKPDRRGLESSVFLSFVNEGDPVARADKAYVKSLVNLFTSSPPAAARPANASRPRDKKTPPISSPSPKTQKSPRRSGLESSSRHEGDGNTAASFTRSHDEVESANGCPKPVWHVPPATLSNAGRLVVLRSGDPNAPLTSMKTVDERLDEGVVAQFTTDKQLRGVVWGDPMSHAMKLYAGRIETLAIGAVMAEA